MAGPPRPATRMRPSARKRGDAVPVGVDRPALGGERRRVVDLHRRGADDQARAVGRPGHSASDAVPSTVRCPPSRSIIVAPVEAVATATRGGTGSKLADHTRLPVSRGCPTVAPEATRCSTTGRRFRP